MADDLQDLIDDYLGDALDEARLRELERRLSVDAEARRHFVYYCRLHTDLHLEARANNAARRALLTLNGPEVAKAPGRSRFTWLAWSVALAAAILLAVGIWQWPTTQQLTQDVPREEIAWLVNAQDCQWAEREAPAGEMRVGKVLRLRHGLAEIRFGSGACVVLEGPANLELLTVNSARLLDGKLTAKVPPQAKGFQVTSPHGKVVDLGTEFAMSVTQDGTTDVYVFVGKVDAYGGTQQSSQTRPVSVQEKQSARMDAAGVALKPAKPEQDAAQFVRSIVPPPRIVPRIFTLDFRRPVAGTLLDDTGLGIGLTHRLPGTGRKLKTQDENLRLETADGRLALKTTNSDINKSFFLDWGEYLGVRLADHGFTGKEDFAVTVVVPNIPELPRVGQFGLFAGPHSKKNIRGGMISAKEAGQYKQFLVQNNKGGDLHPHFLGLGFPGDDLRLTLHRSGNSYSLTVENLTTASSTTITMLQPEFLQGESDFYVGFFGANTQSDERRTLMLKEFKVTVWTVAAP